MLGTRCAELGRDAGDEDVDAAAEVDASSPQPGVDAGDNEPPASEMDADVDATMEQTDSGSPQEPVSSPLLDLAVSAGMLSPAFSSAVTEYRVPVDVTVQTVTVTPKVPSGATAAIDGNAIDLASGWTSGVLDLGDNRVEILVTHEGAAPSTYVLTIARGFQQAYIKASNTGVGDEFGTSVAIAGDVLVVGAPYEDSAAYGINGTQEDDATAQDSGAAYVFRRMEGVWRQTQYLKATNTEAGDHFGASVAISSDVDGKPPGQIIVVGAPGEDGGAVGANGDQSSNSAPDSGAAYVYGLAGDITYLKCGAYVADPGDACGTSVAVWYDWIALGAPGEDGAETGIRNSEGNNDATDSGSVYLYDCGRGIACGGRPASYIKASNAGAQDRFGQSVGLSGVYPANGTAPTSVTLVVGAPGEDGPATGVGGDGSIDLAESLESGAAYVFSFGSRVGQLAYIKPNHVGVSYAFGSSVAISADVIVVGAPREPGSGVGVNGRVDRTSAGSGAAYVYTTNVDAVAFSAYLKATNTGPQDLFGTSVAVSENIIVVGAPGEDSKARGVGGDQRDNTASNTGAAYTYEGKDGIWVPQAYFKSNNPAAQDGFGSSVAISKGTVVVAAAGEDRAGTGIDDPASANSDADASGAVYVFR